MMRSIPPRLRAPVNMLVGGAVIDAIAATVHGPAVLLYFVPITLAAAAGYYVLGGREGDFPDMLRSQSDERQAYRQLKIQALVGRVTTGAAAIAFLIAFAAKATIWPFLLFLTIPCATSFAGWLIYRERPGAGEQHAGH